MWNSNYLDISYKVTNFLPREQVSHRLSYLVGGIIFIGNAYTELRFKQEIYAKLLLSGKLHCS